MANINLEWDAPSSGGTVTEYVIYRVDGVQNDEDVIKASNTANFTHPHDPSVSRQAFQDTTAVLGVTYSYTVEATNAAGPGDLADPANATA